MADNRLSADTVRSLAAQYSDWDAESVVRLAWRESRFVPTAFANDSDDLSYGLLQLNMKPGTADITRLRQMFGITRNEELFDPVVNIRAAHVLYNAAGNTFIRNWGVVPPVANYPTTGGSTTVPEIDDSNPNPNYWSSIKLTSEAAKLYANYGGEGYLAQATTAELEALIAQMDSSEQQIMRAYIAWKSGQRQNPGGGHPSTSVGDYFAPLVDDLTPDWASGLSRLLSVLTSLSFWKKVGVGFIALFLLIGAFALYNKQTIQEVI